MHIGDYMNEREIPDLNLFMVCRKPNQQAYSTLPVGYCFSLCRPDELDTWKRFPLDGNEFDNPEDYLAFDRYMTNFFNQVYSKQEDLFYSKCLFVRNEKGIPVATCFIWKAYHKINTLQWLKVKKEFEDKKIGRALITHVLSQLNPTDFPVYLHTQPASYRAIKLYSDFGFELISDPVAGPRANHLEKSLPILKEFMPEKEFKRLKFTPAPSEFLDTVGCSTVIEF